MNDREMTYAEWAQAAEDFHGKPLPLKVKEVKLSGAICHCRCHSERAKSCYTCRTGHEAAK